MVPATLVRRGGRAKMKRRPRTVKNDSPKKKIGGSSYISRGEIIILKSRHKEASQVNLGRREEKGLA